MFSHAPSSETHELSLELESSASGKCVHRFSLPASHPWVEGHFPGNPVLPAFAQLILVRRCIEGMMGRSVEMSKTLRSRFQAPIAPERETRIILTAEPDSKRIQWKFECGATVCSHGVMEYRVLAAASRAPSAV